MPHLSEASINTIPNIDRECILINLILWWKVLLVGMLYTYTRMKIKKTVTIDSDLVNWTVQKIKDREFGSLSHAIEKALLRLKKEYEKA